MKFTKKHAAKFAALLTSAFVLAACGNGTDTTTAAPAPAPAVPGATEAEGNGDMANGQCPIPESGRVGADPNFGVNTDFVASTPITIDLMYRVHANMPIQEDWLILTALRDDHNVSFNRTDVLIADWDATRNLQIATGNFPTVVPSVWPSQEGDWADAGAILNIAPYFGCMPNLQHLIQEWHMEPDLELGRRANGGIFMLPTLRELGAITTSWAINVDIFEEAGAPTEFATFDDFRDALELVRDNTDVVFPISERWNNNPGGVLGAALNVSAPNFGVPGAGNNRNLGMFNFDTQEFELRIGHPGFEQLIDYWAGLVRDGLLNPHITQEDDAAVADFITGRSAVISTTGVTLNDYLSQAAELGNDLNIRMIAVPDGPGGGRTNGGRRGPGFVFNANIVDNPNFLAILQFIDWIYYSDPGREFGAWGIEGVTFEFDENGVRQYLSDYQGLGPANPNTTNTRRFDAATGFQDEVWGGSITWAHSAEHVQSLLHPIAARWVEDMQAMNKVNWSAEPPITFDPLTAETMGPLVTFLQDSSEAGIAEFILGNRPMSEWDAFVQQIRDQGAQQWLDAANETVNR